MDSHAINKSPSPSHDTEHHPQPHHNPDDDADLQSFIQSGMGITLPSLSMGMDLDSTANTGTAEAHEGVGEDTHHSGGFEVGDFRELMRDGGAERRERITSPRREQGGSGGMDSTEERVEGMRGHKRAREDTAGSGATEEHVNEQGINSVSPGMGGEHDGVDNQHLDKRPRTIEDSPPLGGTTLQDASSSMPLPSMATQQDINSLNLAVTAGPLADVETTQGGAKQETPEERKARQREANRLAAGRSRGKKRDELAILEKTVQNIQEENNRLRAQLEALVSAAHQPATALRHDQSDSALESAGLHHDVNSVDDLVSSHPEERGTPGGGEGVERHPQQQSQQETPPPSKSLDVVPLGFGVDGMDMQVLDGLRRQVEDARREVAEIEARIAAKRATTTTTSAAATPVEEQEVRSHAAAKTRTSALMQEKSALVHLIESLKKERDETELEREVLEREVSARRMLLAGMEDGEEQQQAAGAMDAHHLSVRSGGVEGKKGKSGGEAGRDVGVERALMEVRSWLDNALTGWRKVRRMLLYCVSPSLIYSAPAQTGVIHPPSSIMDNIPNPLIDAALRAHVQQALHEPLLGGPSHTALTHDESQEYEMDAYGHGPALHESRGGDEPAHHHHESPHVHGGMNDEDAEGHDGEGMLDSLDAVGLEHIRFYHESGAV
ncbi:hypothetical protein QFC19_005330 [Naganishia cerealis]|uniref:Uncharacterized protein n=1 Tax=Naganishia cerealis TaxID=610337 RepID=A0ACC2VPJ1_9TREE|nr:hypothetical protein QFC19_005330 [Naganishia cerealis]